MIRTNFHSHTTYCDGKSTPREMIEAAIAGGFSALGFSGHARVPGDTDPYFMTEESEAAYRKELKELREEYRDRIAVYCGIEQDLYSAPIADGYDFAIASVHYVRAEGRLFVVDYTADIMKKTIAEAFGGDAYAYAENYYEGVIALCSQPYGEILGHFDLLTKFNEQRFFFDESHPRYIAAWQAALEAVAQSGKFLEINSGAIPRGYRTSCYPAPPILKRAAELKIPMLLSCDCHSADSLASGWQLSYDYALSCGCTEASLAEAQEAFLSRL